MSLEVGRIPLPAPLKWDCVEVDSVGEVQHSLAASTPTSIVGSTVCATAMCSASNAPDFLDMARPTRTHNPTIHIAMAPCRVLMIRYLNRHGVRGMQATDKRQGGDTYVTADTLSSSKTAIIAAHVVQTFSRTEVDTETISFRLEACSVNAAASTPVPASASNEVIAEAPRDSVSSSIVKMI